MEERQFVVTVVENGRIASVQTYTEEFEAVSDFLNGQKEADAGTVVQMFVSEARTEGHPEAGRPFQEFFLAGRQNTIGSSTEGVGLAC